MSIEHQKYSKSLYVPFDIESTQGTYSLSPPPGLVLVLVLFIFWFPQYGPYIVENETGWAPQEVYNISSLLKDPVCYVCHIR